LKKNEKEEKLNPVTQKAMAATADLKVSPKADTKIKLKSLMIHQAKVR